ncbi:MAG: hypothetical protein KGL39_32035 [Patescibacteria group bacterium]|nr:hypothetical protein [Patescibacteria group bacterium]
MLAEVARFVVDAVQLPPDLRMPQHGLNSAFVFSAQQLGFARKKFFDQLNGYMLHHVSFKLNARLRLADILASELKNMHRFMREKPHHFRQWSVKKNLPRGRRCLVLLRPSFEDF